MSLLILDKLAAAHEALIRALDGNDLAAIETATAALAAGVAEARTIEGRTLDRERLQNLAALALAAQKRVNFLTDRMRERIATLAAIGGQGETFTYQPGAR